jgi:hypothetical protein
VEFGRRGSGVQIAPRRPNLLLIRKELIDINSHAHNDSNRSFLPLLFLRFTGVKDHLHDFAVSLTLGVGHASP